MTVRPSYRARIVGGTVYPGIMATASFMYNVLHLLGLRVNIREVCVLTAPLFSAFTALSAYALTSEASDTSAGIVAAAIISIVPGYISRSVAGSYDNEGAKDKQDQARHPLCPVPSNSQAPLRPRAEQSLAILLAARLPSGAPTLAAPVAPSPRVPHRQRSDARIRRASPRVHTLAVQAKTR